MTDPNRRPSPPPRAGSARAARAEALDRLVDELGDWTAGPGPRYRRLARAVAAAVERGALVRGDRLPSEIAFTRALGASRGTVAAAYDELLGDGIIQRERGNGTFIAGTAGQGLPPDREGSRLVARLVARSAGPSDVIDLSIAVLHDADGLPPVGLTSADLADLVPDTGYSPWGLPSLRSALARRLTASGLPSTPEEVVITTGAQQALSAAIACWVRPGDVVVVEDPTYPGALSALAAAGAVVRGVPVDRDGVQLGPLRAALAERPALVYLQPTVHNPTGALLSRHRREEIARLLTQLRVPLVEDLALAGLAWTPSPDPIASLVPAHPVAVVGSLSKRYWGGLRVGFLRAPAPVAERVARVKATQDLGSSVVSQVLAGRLLEHADSPAFVADRNAELRRRHDALAAALAEALPDWSWTEPAGGLSLWVRLPTPTAAVFAEVALRRGVAVATAEALSATTAQRDRLRLSFAGPVPELREGVTRLTAAWAEHRA